MAKEKSITEMRAEVVESKTKATNLINKAKGESRKLTPDEEKEVNEAINQIAQLSVDISVREALNAGQGRAHVVPGNKFSLRKALLQMVDGKGYSDDISAMNTVGSDLMQRSGVSIRSAKGLLVPVEARAGFIATGAAGTGSDLIETQFLDIMPALRDRLVLSQAGASVMSGLVGNIDIPSYSGSKAEWEGENSAAKDGGGTFSHKSMKPKRLTSILLVSRQLLVQDSLSVENLLRTDLISAVASKLEATILGNHAHAETKPDGLFTGFADAAVDLSWDSIVDLETSADLANALIGNTGYIMHTSLRGKAKKTVKKSAGALGFILDADGTLNGYQALRTNAIASNAVAGETPASFGIAFGNWSDLLIGQWGALDLMVDPYTKADEAFVRIIVNSYWDALPRRDASFSKAFMK